MTRVSENSGHASLQFALNKAKGKMEDLQLKGATLKRITKPSDNPIGNIESLNIGSIQEDNKQYLRNASYGLLQLNATEQAIEQVTEILNQAKEISLAQSSDFYDANIRKNVSNEIIQLRNQMLAIANKRVGSRYIFAGNATLTKPFDIDGKYHGTDGKINVEVSKDFFVPINLTGNEVFVGGKPSSHSIGDSFENLQQTPKAEAKPEQFREIASVEEKYQAPETQHDNIFGLMNSLIAGLENNDPELIRDLLEDFDNSISRLITLRTRVGSIYKSIESTQAQLEKENLDHAERKSYLMDADVAELFSDIAKQKTVLETTYKSSSNLMNKSLLDFLH